MSTHHSESVYLETMRDILAHGDLKPNRTGIDTYSQFGVTLRYDLRDGLPLFTTKRLPIKMIVNELLFFISGETDTRILEDQKIGIWKGNTSREFLEQRHLDYPVGFMGPLYGWQWRYWNRPYHPLGDDTDSDLERFDTESRGIDQLGAVIESIKTDPFSRRHIVSAWNVAQLDEMVLAPCHTLFQFNVSADKKYLDCMLYQRSGDMFLGVPFNVASYSILLSMVARLVDMTPRYFVHTIGDAHIYTTHRNAVEIQLVRVPTQYPRLSFSDRDYTSIDDFTRDDIRIDDYHPQARISAPMAI